MLKRILTICVVLLAVVSHVHAQLDDEQARKWNEPVKPFKIIGNLYYVGATEVSSYLITTPEGHIILDSGFAETVPQIKKNVEELGFHFEDVKIIITSHAHADHVGGVGLLKQMTGAQLAVSLADADLLARGGKNDPNFGDRFQFQAVLADRKLRDRDTVKLGDVTLTARLTPGHTKGCTTWTMKVKDGSKSRDVVIIGSPNVNPGYKFVGNTVYPRITEDYEQTFRVLKSLPVDYFLGAHGSYFDMETKYARFKAGASTAFIDPAGYKNYVEERENAFRRELRKQKSGMSRSN